MTRKDLTQFDVTSIREIQEHADGKKDYEIAGRFTSVDDVEGQHWCYLLAEGHEHLVPQYREWNPETRRALFVCHKAEAVPSLRRYTHLSSNWQAYQVWMIEEVDWPWTVRIFQASDAVSTRHLAKDGTYYRWIKKHEGEPIPEGAELIPGGWDHEHCELCDQHIEPGDDAYVDHSDHWLCSACNGKYRVTRSLAFVREL